MDVLISHQAGVLNAVAVSGIGLTPYHLNSIGRLTNNLVVAFDSDEAGFIAAGRGIDLALEKGFEVRVISLEGGKDPADIASKNPEAWQKAVKGSQHIIDFYLYTLGKNSDPRSFKQKVEKIVLPYILLIESEIERSHWVKEIAKKLNIREEAIWEQLKKIKIIKKQKETEFSGKLENSVSKPKTRYQLLEERLLGIVFWQKNDSIIPDKYKKLLAERKKDADFLAVEAELVYEGLTKEDLDKEIKILLNELEREAIKKQLEELVDEIRRLEAKGDEKTLNEKLNEFREVAKCFNQLFQSNEIQKDKNKT